ncbi:FidL-like protein [Pantoea sp. RRHST58]|uniref:FidL-like protein n=1 Tax=Pantoea sp. RRHST58 TaxID=3425183 RepID=UPI003DA13AC6
MKRSISLTFILLLAALIVLLIGTDYFRKRAEAFPFRCNTFTRYDLSRKEGSHLDFAVTQDLRFQDRDSGYLLLNGQVTSASNTTLLNRRLILTKGEKIDFDTYRYQIEKVITSSTDNTPDSTFNMLLAELTLDPSYLQFDVVKVDEKSYLIAGPLSYLFTCQRY